MMKFRRSLAKGVASIFSPFCSLFLRIKQPIAQELQIIRLRKGLRACGKNIVLYGRNNIFQNLKAIAIGDNFHAGDGLWLATYKNENDKENEKLKVLIGNNVSFSRYCHVGAINQIEIGDNTLIGSNVLITDHAHGESYATNMPRASLPLYSRGGVTIGKNVWICDNVCILPGVKIGDNCIIAAGSVVTKSFEEEGLLIGGIPAKVIKKLEKNENS